MVVEVAAGVNSESEFQLYAALLLVGVAAALALRKLKALAYRGTFYPSNILLSPRLRFMKRAFSLLLLRQFLLCLSPQPIVYEMEAKLLCFLAEGRGVYCRGVAPACFTPVEEIFVHLWASALFSSLLIAAAGWGLVVSGRSAFLFPAPDSTGDTSSDSLGNLSANGRPNCLHALPHAGVNMFLEFLCVLTL